MITVIGNLKGGTGKSTVTFNLAAFLITNGIPIRLFDLDPQATLSDLIDIRREEGHRPAMTVTQQVNELCPQDGVEILVDIGTSDMAAMRAALSMADRIVTPVPPSQADIWSLQRFIRMVREAAQGRAIPPKHLCFINRGEIVPARDTAEARRALQQLRSVRFIDAVWADRPVYRHALSEGVAVFELEPKGEAASEVARLGTILFGDCFIR